MRVRSCNYKTKFRHALFLVFILASCTMERSRDAGPSAVFQAEGYFFPYDLEQPERQWEMPSSLREISGIHWLDEGRLACIQDERGVIYLFNLEEGRIGSEIGFGEDGDYEDIELLGRDAWVLKSNGNLYRVNDFLRGGLLDVTEYKTDLSSKNDAEGLTYDRVSGSLLIALKGHPFLDGRKGGGLKAIYSFDLEENKLASEPFLLIDLDTVAFYMSRGAMDRLGNRILSEVSPSQGDQTFQPSGLAIHPESGHIYVLGAVGRLLLVFSREGEMLAIAGLSPALFYQPEGICFDPQGTLFIASEGGSGSGRVMAFGSSQ